MIRWGAGTPATWVWPMMRVCRERLLGQRPMTLRSSRQHACPLEQASFPFLVLPRGPSLGPFWSLTIFTADDEKQLQLRVPVTLGPLRCGC